MRTAALAILLVPLPGAWAQDPDPVYQSSKQYSLQVKVDALSRQEWTDEVRFTEESRRLLRLRPRVELGVDRFLLGVGGDFLFGSDRNLDPPEGLAALPLLRDNYKSRDARLDLAFLSVKPVSWMRLQGGRFFMPIRFTEMIWDRDLRPQGGALTLEARGTGSFRRLYLTVLGARGSHILPEEGAFDFSERDTVLAFSAGAVLPAGKEAQLELMGAFVRFDDLQYVAPPLRRQNTRVAGGVLGAEYDVVDLVARWQREGKVSSQLVAEYCFNTAVDELNKGVWLAVVLGSTKTARGALEYVYATVDKDATLAAYAADDFLWETGWAGHRVDLGIRMGDKSAFHGIAQRQRFKDDPDASRRDTWFNRYRLELRVSY